ncbi:MAG: hypothetical protein ACOYJL_08350 [Tractidigestivibacter sp.]|jgi:hypothetical protein|uniref:hypothetical protein n=1 Tax=Tractidigestivibacter sp. TaxID=2847320 RepID=UPI003D9200DD
MNNASSASASLIWLEDGVEKKAPEFEEPVRPWLEESSEWGNDHVRQPLKKSEGDDDDGGKPSLIWV